jgi:hypothetical protein
MCDTFNGKLGFKPVDKNCIKDCKRNPLVIPRLYRYPGFGVCEVIADVHEVPDKFFWFEMGGPNGYEADDNYQAMLALTVDNAISLKTLREKISASNFS